MRWACAVVSLLPLITFLIFHDKKDLFGPKNIFSLLYIVGIIIPIVYYSDKANCLTVGNAYLFDALNNDSEFFKYVVLQTLSYHCVMAGIGLVSKNEICGNQRQPNDLVELSSYKFWGYLFVIAGLIAFSLIMRKIGGLAYFISHLQSRTYLVRDLDVLSWILSLAQYGCLLIIASRIDREKPINLGVIILIVMVGLMCGLGGRKALLILVVEAIVIYHYMFKQITISDILNPKIIFALLAILVFFLVLSDLRAEGAFDRLANDPLSFISSSFSGLTSSLVGESYVPFYVKVVEYFNLHELWGGSSFLGLISAFIPSGLFPNKPPVDDGAYLYSICQGRNGIVPPMPFNQLNGSSFPLETFGSMYSNFGAIGLAVGMVILGIIYGLVYKKMHSTSCSLFWTIMYLQVIMTFQLSTLRIFQFIECFVLMGLVIKTSEFLVLKRTEQRSRKSPFLIEQSDKR